MYKMSVIGHFFLFLMLSFPATPRGCIFCLFVMFAFQSRNLRRGCLPTCMQKIRSFSFWARGLEKKQEEREPANARNKTTTKTPARLTQRHQRIGVVGCCDVCFARLFNQQTRTHQPWRPASQWCSVCPPYNVDSMNCPNPMRGRPSTGVGQELLGGVLYISIK